ncbi:diguanylate cyclase (GGDEF)-like protein [Paraburkholderia sp. GAS448]|uniref:diguanylate cyclase domain-containing protein n=1 Tax=Paraburkholderia sp. GAS448 TaxID=3035136 RepID=UPI003D2464AB
MAPEASGTPTPINDRRRPRHGGGKRALAMRIRLGPATMAGASLACLLIGLALLALQVKAIYSDHLKQEYIGLVLDAVERAENARNSLSVLQRAADDHDAQSEGDRHARIDLAARVATLAALVDASPSPAPPIPRSALSPDANPDDTKALLDTASAYWRAQRDRDSADTRTRIRRIADTLIVLSALVFGLLITALVMYAKRTRQLAGESHEFEHAALHDAMTGLPNRRKLLATLEESAARPFDDQTPSRIAVLYIDLDEFKRVNDSFGHRVGDEFLIAVSSRFRQSVRLADVVARIGGDEFAVLVREFSTDAELGAIAQRLIACVTQTDEQLGVGLVRASIGIASFPDPVADYRRLVATADETMYRVKRNGKNGYAFATRAS